MKPSLGAQDGERAASISRPAMDNTISSYSQRGQAETFIVQHDRTRFAPVEKLHFLATVAKTIILTITYVKGSSVSAPQRLGTELAWVALPS